MTQNPIDIHQELDGHNIIFRRIIELDEKSVKALLDAGVDVNIRGFANGTPAIWAATAYNWEFVEIFAHRGADLAIVDDHGISVASAAKISDELQIVVPNSARGRAFENVKQMLREQGLY